MKSQTKAILASVMVLALALSSIGGVTYSWFSDTEYNDITIGTAKLGVTSTLAINNIENGACEVDRYNNIIISGATDADLQLTITNNGSIPVKVIATVVMPTFTAMYYTNNSSERVDHGRVYATYDSNKNIIGFDTDEYFYNSENIRQNNYSKILFGFSENDMVKLTPTQIGYLPGNYEFLGVESNSIRHYEYLFKIGEVELDANGDYDTFSFKMSILQGIEAGIINDFYVRTTAVQNTLTSENLNETGETVINDVDSSKSLRLFNPSTNIRIDRESLTGVNIIKVSVNENNGTQIVIKYFDLNGDEINPTLGDVSISYSKNGVKGQITAKASIGLYTIIAGSIS